MSSVDPSWSPPPESQPFIAAPPPPPVAPQQPIAPPEQAPPLQAPVQRPHPVAYVLAVIMPLILLAAVATPLGAAWLIARQHQSPGSSTTPPLPNPNATDGEPGLGDPYYPQAGNSGYDVTKYQIMINWDPRTQTITGTTTISARATQPLNSFYFDLALHTDKVSVNGVPAESIARGFSDVHIKPAQPIAVDSTFQVVVGYSGKPGDIRQGDEQPWWSSDGEWTVAGEPESSAWWYPANDHPSDPALMDVSIRVPAGMQAISVGRLESADAGNEKDFDTWHWVARQPMASYLNFMTIGQYELKQGIDRGLPYVYAVSDKLPPDQRKTAFAALMTSGQRIRTLETMFGPYPFTEIGGVVPAHQLWFGGLETQTRPVYDARSILNRNFEPGLLTHELAHMWFGDNVTVRQWNDIFITEGYASWAQWGAAERTGGRKANDALNRAYERLKDNDNFWKITMIDPGRAHLFDAVYVRGPMALQALRNVIGDEAFFKFSRDWAQDPGSRTLEEWMADAQSYTTVDLGPFFRAWIYSPTAPARTAANGFRQ
ncbi:MAG TPA: M1 family metallopeptidase [Propionibacteriaceae bacterium]|jgi:aminopeptidase N|nr:M1 family metallopeptidase [Propionibacteriaceae bacterium]